MNKMLYTINMKGDDAQIALDVMEGLLPQIVPVLVMRPLALMAALQMIQITLARHAARSDDPDEQVRWIKESHHAIEALMKEMKLRAQAILHGAAGTA